MREIFFEEYSKKCSEQPLGTKKRAKCMKKLAESIILQCIEDLWDRSSMHESIDFFTERGFSICATLAGMEIGEQVKLLDLVNCTISRIRHLPRKGSRHPERCAPSDFDKTTIATILTSTDPVHHHGIQL